MLQKPLARKFIDAALAVERSGLHLRLDSRQVIRLQLPDEPDAIHVGA
jgi:hypothetical protein